MKKKRFNYFTILIIVLVLLAVGFFYSYLIVEISFEPITGSLSKNSLSLEIYKENITFGETPSNYQINRKTRVDNNFDFPVKINFYPRGKISKFIEVKPNYVYVGPKETGEINISFINYGKSPFGSYQGDLLILTRRTIFGV